MEDCREAATPIATNCLMDADEAGNQVDSTKYRGLIGSLLYLTASRPNIQFGVCLCARFQSNQKESHFKAAKRILKYMKGTNNVGLCYPNESNIVLSDFSNSDYVRCKVDRKSTSGTCYLLGSSVRLPLHQKLVFWYSFSRLTMYSYVLKSLMLMWICLN